MKKTFGILVVVLSLALSTSLMAQQYSYNYKEMSMDEYKAELAKWQQREADAKKAIAEQESCIEQQKAELARLDEEINNVQNEIYALLETDAAGYKAYLESLNQLESDLQGFVSLAPEEIYTRKDELDAFKKRLDEAKKDKRSLTTEAQNKISAIENLIAQAENKAKPAAAGRYEVQRGDYLWKIAKRPDVYGDPYAWMRIYTANRDQIKDPNLIYPQQVFRIPTMPGPDEYWVEKGDYLSKIAGMANVYGNPFRWQKIYEANREIISDPNLIYPYMILVIPKN